MPAELDTRGSPAVEEFHHRGPGRREVLHPPPARDRRAGPDRRTPRPGRHQLLGHIARVSADHLRAACEVGLRDRSRRGIDIHRHDFETRSSECHGVRADPTAEVEHPANACLDESARVVVSDLGSRRLLQTSSW